MDAKTLQTDLCGGFRVSSGPDGFSIQTPFTYDDGDHVVVFVTPLEDGQFRVDDNGESAFRLMVDGVNIDSRKAKSWLSSLEATHGVVWDDDNEELYMVAAPNKVAEKAMKVAECSAQMQVLNVLRQDRQLSTFKDEIIAVLRQIERDTNIPAHYDFPADPNKQIYVDAYFRSKTPVAVVIATSNERLLEAELLWSATQNIGDPTRVIAVFEDRSKLSERHLNRASYYTDKAVPWRQMSDAFQQLIRAEVSRKH